MVVPHSTREVRLPRSTSGSHPPARRCYPARPLSPPSATLRNPRTGCKIVPHQPKLQEKEWFSWWEGEGGNTREYSQSTSFSAPAREDNHRKELIRMMGTNLKMCGMIFRDGTHTMIQALSTSWSVSSLSWSWIVEQTLPHPGMRRHEVNRDCTNAKSNVPAVTELPRVVEPINGQNILLFGLTFTTIIGPEVPPLDLLYIVRYQKCCSSPPACTPGALPRDRGKLPLKSLLRVEELRQGKCCIRCGGAGNATRRLRRLRKT